MLLAGCLALAYIVCMPVLYGMFSFKDGWDDWNCYASQDSDIMVPWTDQTASPPDDYHNVGSNFYVVNLWGFINFAVLAGIACLALAVKCIWAEEEYWEGIIGLGMILVALSYISHFFTMVVMRWRHAGRVCAGDFDPDLHFYSPLDGNEGSKPFLHSAGSWFFYLQATHLYIILMLVSGASFAAGTDNY